MDFGPGLSWSMSRLTLLVKEHPKQLTHKIPSFLLQSHFGAKKKICVLLCTYFEWRKLIIQCSLGWENQIQEVL